MAKRVVWLAYFIWMGILATLVPKVVIIPAAMRSCVFGFIFTHTF